MKKRFVIYLPLLFALVLAAGIFLGHQFSPSSGSTQLFNLNVAKYNKVNDVVNYILSEYVDSVSREQIEKDGIDGILKNLDPHSQYIPASDFEMYNEPLVGNFEGIGIQFQIEKDTIAVIHTIPGGPSEKSGLMAGDRLVRVNDSLIAGVGIDNLGAMKKLKGKRGTHVRVDVFRRGVAELLSFDLVRDMIPTYSIDIAYMPVADVGYIKVNKFSATTYDEFEKAIDDLIAQGMKKVILDLRGNSGGYLTAAINMADEFLPEGKLIVFTQGRSQPRESFYARSKGKLINAPLVVLIDEGTASAAEIVTGALQDNDRGTIIGRRSFGKGLVQRQLDLRDGSAIRLTIARYYTPTGRCIQKPYDPKKGFDAYYYESIERYDHGEMDNKDSIPHNDSLKYVTEGGKIVYGGGGIMPDIFVPLDRNPELKYFNRLVKKRTIYNFMFNYTDVHRSELNLYKNFVDFDKQFVISPVLLHEFYAFANAHGLAAEKTVSDQSAKHIQILLKAYLARNLFDNQGFYPIYHQIDEPFQEALKILSKNNNNQ